MAKLTAKEQERVISLYATNMSVSDIARTINKDKPQELQVSHQAISKILAKFKSCNDNKKGKTDNKEVARTIYNKAMESLQERVDKATPTELLKIIEYYDIKYNFAEEGSDEKVTAISIVVEDGTVNDETTN